MKAMIRTVLFVYAFHACWNAPAVPGQMRVPCLIGDGMVLQRSAAPIPVGSQYGYGGDH